MAACGCRYAPACERVVNMAGLKTLFAIFMGRSRLKGQRRTDASTQRAEEERVVSVICNLLTVPAPHGACVHSPPATARTAAGCGGRCGRRSGCV